MKLISLIALAATALSATFANATAVAETKSTAIPVPNAIVSPRDVQTYSASNVGGVSWDRPLFTGICCSLLGPVLLHQQTFTVSANDSCNISSVQNDWDGFLLLYSAGFDPANPTVNFLAANDDGVGGIGTSEINAVSLNAGTTYHVVTTGYNAGEEGDFTNTITCPSALVAIGGIGTPPQPSTFVPVPSLGQFARIVLGLLAGLIGVATLRRV